MIAFINVNIVPMDCERVLENQVIVIEGERIKAIGPAGEVPIPDEAERIAAGGAYLMPGLADMHMHFTSLARTFEGPGQLLFYLAEGVTSIRNLSAMPDHLTWQREIARGERVGPTIYNGRQVVGLPESLAFRRYAFRAIFILTPLVVGVLIWLTLWFLSRLNGSLAEFQQAQRYILPSLAGLLLLGGVAAWLKPVPLNTYLSFFYPFATFPETGVEARRFVREIKRAGYDFVKVYDLLSEEAYLAALEEARLRNMYTVGHLLDELSQELKTILSAGLREVAHIDEFTDAHMIGEASPNRGVAGVSFNYRAIPQTVAAVKARDVMVVSNLVADEVIYKILEDVEGRLSQPEYTVVPPPVLNTWKTRGRFVNWTGQESWRRERQMPFLKVMAKALHDAGVPLLIGTDMTVEGMVPAHIHRDLELLVEAGLSPFEALEAGTRNAGLSVERMGRDGSFGTVEVGQRADLILLEDNPLESVSRTRNRIGVMARGQWFTQAELDELVVEYLASY